MKKLFVLIGVMVVLAAIAIVLALFVYVGSVAEQEIGDWQLSYSPTTWTIPVDNVTNIAKAAELLKQAKAEWESEYPHLKIKKVRIEMAIEIEHEAR